jgi:hypothetical protein
VNLRHALADIGVLVGVCGFSWGTFSWSVAI